MPNSFVGILDSHNRKKIESVEMRLPGPMNMIENATGNFCVACFMHYPGSPELSMVAAVVDSVSFAQVVQQSSGKHGFRRNIEPFFICLVRQGQGQAGHKLAVCPDVIEHMIFVPKSVAIIWPGDKRFVSIGPGGNKQR